jgi:hypothetical protein
MWENSQMSAQKIDHDEKSTRDSRAHKILATARANLVGHVSRDDRVVAALKLARRNVIRLDPKAAAARQYRVKRTLDAARAALKRVAHVHRTSERERVAPEAPSPTPRRQREAPPPSADAIESLSYQFQVLREAVPEAMGKMLADLRTECQRETDRLRRELDVSHRELDLVHRALVNLRALSP